MTEETTVADRLLAAAVITEGFPTAQRVLRSGLKRIVPKDLWDRFALGPTIKAQNEKVLAEMIAAVNRKMGTEALPDGLMIQSRQFNSSGRGLISMGSLGETLIFEEAYGIVRLNPSPLSTKPNIQRYQAEVPKTLFCIVEKVSAGAKYEELLKPFLQMAHHRHGSFRKTSPEWAVKFWKAGAVTEDLIEQQVRKDNPTLTLQHAEAYGVNGSVVFNPIEDYMAEIPERVMGSYLAARALGFTEFLVAEPKIENAGPFLGVKVEEKVINVVFPQPPDPVLIGILNDVMFEIDFWE